MCEKIFLNRHLSSRILNRYSVSDSLINLLKNFQNNSERLKSEIINDGEYKRVFGILSEIDILESKVRGLIDEYIEDIGFDETYSLLPDFPGLLKSNDIDRLEKLHNQIINIDTFEQHRDKVQSDRDNEKRHRIVQAPLQTIKIVDKKTLLQALEKRLDIKEYMDAFESERENETDGQKNMRKLESQATLYFVDKLDTSECFHVFKLINEIQDENYIQAHSELSRKIRDYIPKMKNNELEQYLNMYYRFAYFYHARDRELMSHTHMVCTELCKELQKRIENKAIPLQEIVRLFKECKGLAHFANNERTEIGELLVEINDRISYNSGGLNKEQLLSIKNSYDELPEGGFERNKQYHVLCNLLKVVLKELESENLVDEVFREEESMFIESLDEYNFPKNLRYGGRYEGLLDFEKPIWRGFQEDRLLLRLLNRCDDFYPGKLFFIAHLCGGKEKFHELFGTIENQEKNDYSTLFYELFVCNAQSLKSVCEMFEINTIDKLQAFSEEFSKISTRGCGIIRIKDHNKLHVFEHLKKEDIKEIVRMMNLFDRIKYLDNDVSSDALSSQQIKIFQSFKAKHFFNMANYKETQVFKLGMKEGNQIIIENMIKEWLEWDNQVYQRFSRKDIN